MTYEGGSLGIGETPPPLGHSHRQLLRKVISIAKDTQEAVFQSPDWLTGHDAYAGPSYQDHSAVLRTPVLPPIRTKADSNSSKRQYHIKVDARQVLLPAPMWYHGHRVLDECICLKMLMYGKRLNPSWLTLMPCSARWPQQSQVRPQLLKVPRVALACVVPSSFHQSCIDYQPWTCLSSCSRQSYSLTWASLILQHPLSATYEECLIRANSCNITIETLH